jgi:hypothetical protein
MKWTSNLIILIIATFPLHGALTEALPTVPNDTVLEQEGNNSSFLERGQQLGTLQAFDGDNCDGKAGKIQWLESYRQECIRTQGRHSFLIHGDCGQVKWRHFERTNCHFSMLFGKEESRFLESDAGESGILSLKDRRFGRCFNVDTGKNWGSILATCYR